MQSDQPKRGRPKKADAKVHVSLRLSPDLLAAMKKIGPGWQSHAHDVLRLAYLSGAGDEKAAPGVARMAVKPKLRVVSGEHSHRETPRHSAGSKTPEG